MKQPNAPAFRMFTADSTAYTYESMTGQLAVVRDPAGNSFTYAYDTVGRVVKQVARAGTADSVRVATAYDAESERIAYAGESATYDARGKMFPSSDSLVYAPLGALKYSSDGSVIESYDPDVLGNSWRTDVSGPDLPVTQPKFAKYWAGSGQLIQETRVNGRWMDTTNHVYNGLNGALQQTDVKTVADTIGGIGGGNSRWKHNTTNNHYDKQAQLDSTQYIVDTIPFSAGHQYTDYMAVEMYRYDALNRRVWMRNIRGANCYRQDQSSGCRSNLRRTIWDGDQILYEIQVKADSASTSLESDSYTVAPYYGTIAYTHGIGIDAPLALYKDYKSTMVTPRQDMSGKFIDGTCHPSACGSLQIYWPEATGSQFSILGMQSTGPPSWYGSIIEGQQDASGYQYKRNRYYDPQTGKFTQEDPIGLAGGLNAYGFAGGDPINYSDPFGLCPIPANDCPPGYFTALGFGLGAALGGLGGGGGGFVAGAGVGAVPGAAVGMLKGAAAGAVLGGLADGMVLSSKQARAVNLANSLAGNIADHLSTVEQDPNAEDANHHRGEIRSWINRVEKFAKDMKGKTQDEWLKKVAEWKQQLNSITPN